VDPLAHLELPSDPLELRGSVRISGSQTATLEPGIYTEIRATGDSRLVLNSGVYVIAGGEFKVTGSAGIQGSDVFIYQAGSAFPNPGGQTGDITFDGNGTFDLSARTQGEYAGVLIFQARDNAQTLTINTLLAGLEGAIYAPAAQLNLAGAAEITTSIIVDRLRMSGSAASRLVTSTETNADDAPVAVEGQLLSGEVKVAMRDDTGALAADHWDRFRDALHTLNVAFGPYGVTLVESDAEDYAYANVQIDLSPSSTLGGVAEGVLGCTAAEGQITLIVGWNWYAGTEVSEIGQGEYDFQTIVTHELGHAIGLAHSGDDGSVMYAMLADGQTRRQITTQDLSLLRDYDDDGPEALRVAPLPANVQELVSIDRSPAPGIRRGDGVGNDAATSREFRDPLASRDSKGLQTSSATAEHSFAMLSLLRGGDLARASRDIAMPVASLDIEDLATRYRKSRQSLESSSSDRLSSGALDKGFYEEVQRSGRRGTTHEQRVAGPNSVNSVTELALDEIFTHKKDGAAHQTPEPLDLVLGDRLDLRVDACSGKLASGWRCV
jgi:hypothetical protein